MAPLSRPLSLDQPLEKALVPAAAPDSGPIERLADLGRTRGHHLPLGPMEGKAGVLPLQAAVADNGTGACPSISATRSSYCTRDRHTCASTLRQCSIRVSSPRSVVGADFAQAQRARRRWMTSPALCPESLLHCHSQDLKKDVEGLGKPGHDTAAKFQHRKIHILYDSFYPCSNAGKRRCAKIWSRIQSIFRGRTQ
jgi:hypothetical protein